MKLRFADSVVAGVVTTVLCVLLFESAKALIVPCILQGSPEPPDYPSYCSVLNRIPPSMIISALVLPILILIGRLVIIQKVRKA